MKTLQHTLIALMTLVGLSACTHNDGDIGTWFGTWQVEDISCASTDCTGYTSDCQNYYFQFQGDICTVRYVSPMHDEEVDYGTWSEGDGTLDIDFPDSNVAYFHVFANLLNLESSPQHLHFTINSSTSTEVTLAYTDATGNNWTLLLRKQ